MLFNSMVSVNNKFKKCHFNRDRDGFLTILKVLHILISLFSLITIFYTYKSLEHVNDSMNNRVSTYHYRQAHVKTSLKFENKFSYTKEKPKQHPEFKLRFKYKSSLLIRVYYEALEIDSEGFVKRQLIPTYQKIPDLVEIQLIPYGRAGTYINLNGKFWVNYIS